MGKRSKRDDILNATLKLIVQYDLDHTSMDMIAREARVGMGTIYNYFPGKEALVNELYRGLKQKVVAMVLTGYSPDAPIREQFFTMWRNMFNFYLRQPDVFQFLEQYSMSPIITPESKEFGWKLWETPIQVIEQGRRQQIVKDLPIDMLMLIANSPIYNLVREHIHGRIHLDKSKIEAAITACWDAIKL
jgi:TetR/AcrR family transcriptional regulator, repressor of fatR-cypB operon